MAQQKRYQIFVSSTFGDLEEERGKVMETILNYDCFPAGMELFPAMDEAIFEYIKRIIDDSDYYLLIIGGRYGSMDKNDVSWTEKEYDYAVSKGIPVIAFDHKDFTRLPANKIDLDDKKREKLIAFKEKVSTGRLIKKWTDSKDLALAVATSLNSVLQLQPRIGWVRADKVDSGVAQKEIDKLKKEIAKYETQVKRLEAKVQKQDEVSKKKNKDYSDLASLYQAAQQEIERLNGQINACEAQLEKYKALSVKSKPKTKMFTVEGVVSFKMVFVEGGTFMMGANDSDSEAGYVERPAHEVTLSDYWIGETQVTQALWQAVMGENPSRFKSDLNRPVERVSWLECKVFIKKLNELTGKNFRLPTEAQWEFAARGGNLGKDNGLLFSGSYDISDVAWFRENSQGKTHPVGELDPNELGLYDMTGNVWEWCQDRFENSYYMNSPKNDPKGPITGNYRVNRGGSWRSDICMSRVTFRGNSIPSAAEINVGLRLALDDIT